RHPFFAMNKAAISAGGITPESLYFPDVFVWIPTLLNGDNKHVFKDHKCIGSGGKNKELSIKGFNDNPIACRVTTLDSCYYILTQRHNVAKAYPLFSKFEDESGYAGLAPHRSYITTLYIDFIEHACHVLDQCVAALPAGVIKWDHSFKVPKFMMKLNGTITFSSLFSLENEFSQLQYQSFVPTKSLSHVRTALEYISKSLEDHGLPQPNLGFTDNVASDYATFAEIFPLLSEGV
ncbi:hypothetical protein K443DRAFT_73432, partial [Laccaria amethystina LaAM-08-1]